ESVFPPTLADIRYGPHERNVLDVWLANSERPAPLLICIHGGGFSGGDKEGFHGEADLIPPLLESGVSVAAINYRLTEGGKNAYPIPMRDGARAVQFLRHHADKYNLDKKRFGATGGSAGGCMLMWLGFHPDLSQPDHEDPVQRESSRLQVLAPFAGQSCLHIPTLEEWFGVKSLTLHPAYRPLFRLSMEGPVKWTEGFDAAMRAASPITYLTDDDPPIYLAYGQNQAVIDGSHPDVWVHHPIMGTELQKAMQELGLECHVEYPGGPPVAEYASQLEFVIKKLTNSTDE
ncbi:MAG: alpha/beta hydrolase, partial [Planctomycetota bacterium]